MNRLAGAWPLATLMQYWCCVARAPPPLRAQLVPPVRGAIRCSKIWASLLQCEMHTRTCLCLTHCQSWSHVGAGRSTSHPSRMYSQHQASTKPLPYPRTEFLQPTLEPQHVLDQGVGLCCRCAHKRKTRSSIGRAPFCGSPLAGLQRRSSIVRVPLMVLHWSSSTNIFIPKKIPSFG